MSAEIYPEGWEHAWRLGQEAFTCGTPDWANPYPLDHPLREYWIFAWISEQCDNDTRTRGKTGATQKSR